MCEPTDAPCSKDHPKEAVAKIPTTPSIRYKKPASSNGNIQDLGRSHSILLQTSTLPSTPKQSYCSITLEHSGGVSVQSPIAHPDTSIPSSPVLLPALPGPCSTAGPGSRAQPILLCPHSQFPAANPLTRPQNPHGELQLFPLISYKASFSLAPIPKEGKKPSRIVSGSKYG